MKPYIFNGEEFNDVDSLAKAYINNFDLGVEDIYTNSKKLIKFLKDLKKSKEYVGNIVNILAYSKYKNNALTFLIFQFLDEKQVYINGQLFDFKSFLTAIKENPSPRGNILFAFMEDYGITKTFALMEDDPKLQADAYFIDKNAYSQFTYKYLISYYDYKIIESLNSKISTIAVNGDECFRRASKVASNDDFQLGIAHKVGFKDAVCMHNEVNPLFYAVKLLKQKNECDDETLKKVITDTFYWWLIDNLDKYQILKKEAKDTFLNLIALKREFDKYKEQILQRKITAISLDLLIELSRNLYLNYINFVILFREGKIKVKSRFNESQYDFDKPYCKTYICADFMKGRVVKLYHTSQVENMSITVNPLTGDEIESEENVDNDINLDDVSNDRPELVKVEDDSVINKIKKNKKVLNKKLALAKISFGMALLFMILAIANMVVALIGKNTNVEFLVKYNEKINNQAIGIIVISAIVGIACAVLACIIMFKINKHKDRLNSLEFIYQARGKEVLNEKQEAKLINLSLNEEKYKASIGKNFSYISILLYAFINILFACLLITQIAFGSAFTDIIKFDPANSMFMAKFAISLLAGAILVSVYTFFRRKGGVSPLILSLIVNIGINAVVFLLM